MGNSKYLDGLSQDERNALVKQLWNIQNHKLILRDEEMPFRYRTVHLKKPFLQLL